MTGKRRKKRGRLTLAVNIIQAVDLKCADRTKRYPDPYVVLLLHPQKKVRYSFPLDLKEEVNRNIDKVHDKSLVISRV